MQSFPLMKRHRPTPPPFVTTIPAPPTPQIIDKTPNSNPSHVHPPGAGTSSPRSLKTLQNLHQSLQIINPHSGSHSTSENPSSSCPSPSPRANPSGGSKQAGSLQYTGAVGSHLVSLKQLDDGDVAYCVHSTTFAETARLDLLDFLNVGICVGHLWETFSASDTRFAQLAAPLCGARVLRQDPLECLIQFICSSNNNIKRMGWLILSHHLGIIWGVLKVLSSMSSLLWISCQEFLRKS